MIIHFGKLSPIGYPIAGGDFSGRQARELSMYQADLQVNKSVTYEFTPASGGNSERSHPNATLAVRVVSPASWQLSVSAQVNGDPSVTVDQLSFKEDAQTAYIPFTLHPQPAGSGPAGTFLLFYDLALRVDSDDRPGSYSWSITYTLSAY